MLRGRPGRGQRDDRRSQREECAIACMAAGLVGFRSQAQEIADLIECCLCFETEVNTEVQGKRILVQRGRREEGE